MTDPSLPPAAAAFDEPSSGDAGTPSLPPAPRPVTPRASSQSWAETRVRLWLALALLTAIAIAWTLYIRIDDGLAQRDLQSRSRPATAVVREVRGAVAAREVARSEVADVKVDLTADWLDGKQTVIGNLPARPGGRISVGDTLHLNVDPTNLRRFSDLPPTGWGELLTLPLAMMPVAAILLGAAFVQRRGVLGLYARGEERTATVIDAHRAPLTPGARLVKVALTGAGSKRLITIVRPDRLGPVDSGQELTVLTDPNRPARALSAEAYS